VSLHNCFILSTIFFSISISGLILNRENIILLFISSELMLLSISTNLVALSHFKIGFLSGKILVLFILTIAAAELSIGLAIVISLFQKKKNINIKNSENI